MVYLFVELGKPEQMLVLVFRGSCGFCEEVVGSFGECADEGGIPDLALNECFIVA